MIRKLIYMSVAAAFAFAMMAVLESPAQAAGTVTLSGDITHNMTLKKSKTYVLQGGVFVRTGATLKIKPGTQIVGTAGSFLVIDKGGKMIAKGTKTKPIVFTSAQPEGQRARVDWGGLIFNGDAPVNCAGTAGGTCDGEGGTGAYGGTDPHDNQGVMKYVRVEF